MTTIRKQSKNSKAIAQKRPVKAPRKKPRGLPRPKSQPTYNLPTTITKSPSSQLATDTDTPISTLSRIKLLLHLIVRRNKNQHRTQQFWKWLCLLRRAITHLLTLRRRAEQSSTTKPAATVNADAIRRTFETQAEIRSQREVHDEWTREVLVPGCYVAFSAVVADKQFANLGVVLMGVLGDVIGVVGPMRKIEDAPKVIAASATTTRAIVAGIQGGSITAVSTMVTGPDQGEVVERQYESDGADVVMDVQFRSLDDRHDEGVVVERKQQGSSILFNEDMVDKMGSNPLDNDQMAMSSPSPAPEINTVMLVSPLETKTSISKRKTQLLSTTTVSLPSPGESIVRSTLLDPSTSTPSALATTNTAPKTKSSKLPSSTSPGITTVKAATSSTGVSDTKMKKKKKKEKGNAIDDLFGGFT